MLIHTRLSIPAWPALFGLCLLIAGCGAEIAPPQPERLSVFEDVTVHFTPDDPSRYDSPFATAADNGRVMGTYLEMKPRRGVIATLRLEVRPIRKDIRNMVDRWDRAGHVALVKPGREPVEMARFMTAYGGAISHEVDITHLLPLLRGHCGFEVFIDTWVSPAWTVDAAIVFSPATGPVDAPDWAEGVLFPAGGLNAETPEAAAEITIPGGTRRVSVFAIVSGHCTDGRDADEFITKDNVLTVDGREVHRWRPWRDDCREFRAVNPYCAKWADGSWSSDYSRSGWCPGDMVRPVEIRLDEALSPGPHTLAWRIEGIRPADPDDPDGHHGYWRISASVAGWR